MPQKNRCSILFIIFIVLFVNCAGFGRCFSSPLPGDEKQPGTTAGGNIDVEKTYKDARFSFLAEHLNKKDYSKLLLREKLLLIECLSRTAQGPLAKEKMKTILREQPAAADILTTAGILYTALGQLVKANLYIKRALTIDENFPAALLARAMLHLYFQRYREAETCCEKLVEKNPGWKETYLFLFAGLEIYKGSRNPVKLKEMYDLLAKKNKKNDKISYQNFKATSRFLKKALKGTLFDVETAADRVTVPFAGQTGSDDKKTILLNFKDRCFRVLLDTGNAVGWFIYSSELRDRVKVVRGGKAFTRIGIEDTSLEGHHIYCKRIDFGNFTMSHVAGQFLVKPHPDFYDANLNPLFIRNRVVTLDFIRQEMVLTTKERFEKELAGRRQGVTYARLPWYGYECAYVPVNVGGTPGLAMIETGAEDIALKLDFARELGLPLKPQNRYFANGKVFQYHKTPVSLSIDKFTFRRENAEVWPLNRIYNPITGLTAHVVIGPTVLQGKFAVSFDPFEKKVILEYGPGQR
ncbi:MAG: aspartyl protease family protein [Candidatus Aminicenantes bacterium]|nr:aspartyl protease family protein [Candidatus Aminicenantes bacterium]